MHSLFTLAFTPTSRSETILAVAHWSSSSGGSHSTNITRLYCTICKRTDLTNRLCRHSRSCNRCKKTGHIEPKCFNPLRVTSSGTAAEEVAGTSPLHTSLAGSRAMSVGTIQSLPSDPIDIQHQLTQIELQLSASQHSLDPLPRPSLLPRVCLHLGF